MRIATNGAIQFNDYGAGTLVTDSSGNITVSSGGGAGGPYLPLAAGSSFPLTGDLYVGTSTAGTDRFIRAYYSDSTYTEMRGYGIITNRAGSYYRPVNDKTQVLAIGNDGNTWNYISQNANYHTFGKDTSEWMRIDTSGNVGIGTTSPSRLLDVDGIQGWSLNNAEVAYMNPTLTGADFLLKNSSGTGVIRLDGRPNANSYFNTGGNVGIGTASPDQKLHVSGNARVTGAYYDSNNSPGASGQVLSSTATGTDWVSAGGTSGFAPMVKFNRSGINSSTYTMIATVNGNKLSSVLKMTMTGTSNGVVFACTFDITVNHHKDIHVKSSNGDYTEVTLRITSNDNEDFSIEAKHNGSTTTQAEVCIFPLADEIITPTTTDPGYTGAEYEHTATEGWRYGGVDNSVESSNVIVDGKIGIGTTSPGAKLEVNGNVAINSTGLTEGFQWFNDTNEIFSLEDTAGAGELLLLSSNSVKVKLNANGSSYLNGGNVGIGTTSPGSKIHVNGTSERILIGDSSAGENWINGQDLGGFAFKTHYNLQEKTGMYAVGMLHGSGSNYIPHLHFKTSSTTRLAIDNNGNVGIGTTSPDEMLHIENSSGANIILNSNTGAVNNGIYMSEGTSSTPTQNGAYFYYDSSANAVKLDTGTSSLSTKLTVSRDSGNVGIGTTSPAKTLHVFSGTDNEGIFMQGTGGGHWFNFQSGTSNLWSMGAQTGMMGWYNRTTGNVGYKMVIQDGGNVGIGTTSPGDVLVVKGGSPGNIDLVSFQNNAGNETHRFYADSANDGVISTVTNAGVIANLIQSSGDSYFNGGNVGIGTTSPGVNFQVGDGTTDTSSKFYHNDNTYTQVSGYGLYFSRLSSYIRPVFDGTQDLYFGNINRTWKSIQFDATTITFDNNSSEAMRITSSGNVGIGTTSPSSKLHVNYEDAESVLTISRGGTNLSAGTAIGTIQFNADYQGSPISYGSIDMYANSLSGVRSSLDFNVKSTSGGIQTGLTVQGNSGTPRVGIGTTSPSHLLTLETASSPGLKIKDTTQGATLLAFSQDSNSHIGTYSSHPLVFDTNSAERMRIDSSGNVGIGTSSPGDKLHVNGTVRSQAPATSDWALLGYNSAGSSSSGLWFENGSGDILLRRSDNSLQTRIRSAGSSYINGGSLGLGTTSPAQKLTVNSGRMLVSNTTTPIYIKAGSTYKSWVHHIGGSDGYIFAPSTADNGETWDWANQTKLGANGVVTAKNFQLSSDERFKNNIKDIKDIKVEAAFKSFEMESSPGEKRYGVVAQELEKNKSRTC